MLLFRLEDPITEETGCKSCATLNEQFITAQWNPCPVYGVDVHVVNLYLYEPEHSPLRQCLCLIFRRWGEEWKGKGIKRVFTRLLVG